MGQPWSWSIGYNRRISNGNYPRLIPIFEMPQGGNPTLGKNIGDSEVECTSGQGREVSPCQQDRYQTPPRRRNG